MRRVQCRACGVKVEQVPWATGKHTLTRAYMLHLAHWARKLSWKETALQLSHQLGEGLPGGRVRRAVGARAPRTGFGPGHRRRRDRIRPRPQVLDAGLPDRGRLHAPAVGRQGAHERELRAVLHHDRPGAGRQDRVRLLGHVAALPGPDRQALHQSAQHPGPLPCRGQAEPGARRRARRRGAPHGARGLRAGAQEDALVSAQAAREPDRHAAHEAARICCATTCKAFAPTCSRKSSSSSGSTTPRPGRASSSITGAPRRCAHASSR